MIESGEKIVDRKKEKTIENRKLRIEKTEIISIKVVQTTRSAM